MLVDVERMTPTATIVVAVVRAQRMLHPNPRNCEAVRHLLCAALTAEDPRQELIEAPYVAALRRAMSDALEQLNRVRHGTPDHVIAAVFRGALERLRDAFIGTGEYARDRLAQLLVVPAVRDADDGPDGAGD